MAKSSFPIYDRRDRDEFITFRGCRGDPLKNHQVWFQDMDGVPSSGRTILRLSAEDGVSILRRIVLRMIVVMMMMMRRTMTTETKNKKIKNQCCRLSEKSKTAF